MSKKEDKFYEVKTTFSNQEESLLLARKTVQEKLAACAQVIPNMTAVYHWENEIEEATEFLVVMKTEESLLKKLFAKIRSLHSYKTPEIIAVPIKKVDTDYSKWLESVLKI